MAKRTELKINLGDRFGKLVVLDKVVIPGWGTRWKCVCDCGKETMVAAYNLAKSNTRSCGCLLATIRITHGMTNTRAYGIWKTMHQRCTNANREEYKNYGGRGIVVCERWKSFESFLEDMGHPPKGLTLERQDNNGSYCKENCRWATRKDQLNNRRNNRTITAFGKTQSVTLWAQEKGIPVTTLRNRLFRAEMSAEDALLAPLYAQQRS